MTNLQPMLLRAALLALCGLSLAACTGKTEGPCDTVTFESTPYLVCSFDAETDDIRLFLRDEAGAPFGQFDRLANHVASQGGSLIFAMNAGMYHEDRRPVGLYVEEEQSEMGLVKNAGPGNFGMLPNGVFWIEDGSAGVTETLAYADRFADEDQRRRVGGQAAQQHDHDGEPQAPTGLLSESHGCALRLGEENAGRGGAAPKE